MLQKFMARFFSPKVVPANSEVVLSVPIKITNCGNSPVNVSDLLSIVIHRGGKTVELNTGFSKLVLGGNLEDLRFTNSTSIQGNESLHIASNYRAHGQIPENYYKVFTNCDTMGMSLREFTQFIYEREKTEMFQRKAAACAIPNPVPRKVPLRKERS